MRRFALPLLLGFSLASCAGQNATPPASTGAVASQSASLRRANGTAGFSIVYAFPPDPVHYGDHPNGHLTELNGDLYGTAAGGANGDGVVYKVSGGVETLLHSFSGGDEGVFPVAGVAYYNGLFYGATCSAEVNSPVGGSAFSMDLSGNITILHKFTAPGDGDCPTGKLLFVNGLFYGTTPGGGAFKYGTVFSLSPTGAEKVVYSFAGGKDGAAPSPNLTFYNGALYGTTFAGGGVNNAGTVFRLTTSGNETILHHFFEHNYNDGKMPMGHLMVLNGVLYGATMEGGTNGTGTVFSVARFGVEKVLYSFGTQSSGDVILPSGGLTLFNGVLYGGAQGGGGFWGVGGVYSVTPAGTETVVHSFSHTDGATPVGNLLPVGNSLYGATAAGDNSNGEIFSITP